MSTVTERTIRKTDLEDLRWVAREAVARAVGLFHGCCPQDDGLEEVALITERAWALGALGLEYDLPIPGTEYDEFGDSVRWPMHLSDRHVATLRDAADDLEEFYMSGMDDHDHPEERAAFYGARAERARRVRVILEAVR